MRERFNEALLGVIAIGFQFAAGVFELVFRFRLRHFRDTQRRLRRALGVNATTPISSFEQLGPSLDAARARLGRRAVEVATSGSTRTPKRLVYTRRRIRMSRVLFIDVFARLMRALQCRRWSLFVLAPRGDDDSLSSQFLREERMPTFVECLEGPYRVMRHPAFTAACEAFGETAARVWLLAISNPGFLYATNPSTLAVFFESVESEWPRVVRLCEAWLSNERPELDVLYRRTATAGARARVKRMVLSSNALPTSSWLPGLEVFACWDGGYVRPFLERVLKFLPATEVKFLPMYSMSTEVVETLGVPVGDAPDIRAAFLPVAPGVLYEFLPTDADDAPENLRTPDALEVGKRYALVASDGFGLIRYQTEDVFECVGFVNGLPDLRFVGRRGLTYSFTGEKLTADQLTLAYAEARRTLSLEGDATHLCTFPTLGRNGASPAYVLVRVVAAQQAATGSAEALAREVDAALCRINDEYRHKRESGRLGPFAALECDVPSFVTRVAGPAAVATWENQFKFLPLSPRLWNEVESA